MHALHPRRPWLRPLPARSILFSDYTSSQQRLWKKQNRPRNLFNPTGLIKPFSFLSKALEKWKQDLYKVSVETQGTEILFCFHL
jgi:hypothetical protein